MRIAVVVGNPKPSSRTRVIAERLAGLIDPGADIRVIDLADYADRLFRWPDDELSELTAQVAEHDLLIVATPTFKATYSGLLKAFLDRYPHRGLQGCAAIGLMTIGSDAHQLACDWHLRPLLIELGAMVPTAALPFPMPRFDQLDRVLEEWIAQNQQPLALIGQYAPRPRS